MSSLFSFGNHKIPKTTALFNITPAFNCPSDKLGLCNLKDSGKCYAKKAERQYPSARRYRDNQQKYWDSCTVDDFIRDFISACSKKPKYLRLNESGDFKNQKDVNKAIKIAKRLYDGYGIRVYCHTARRDLDFSRKGELVVNGSGFMLDNKSKVIGRKESTKGFICPKNCDVCNACMSRKHRVIHWREH